MPKLIKPKERHYKLAEFLQMGLKPAKAAIRAGFKPSTARKQAKRICSHPAVQVAILEIQTRGQLPAPVPSIEQAVTPPPTEIVRAVAPAVATDAFRVHVTPESAIKWERAMKEARRTGESPVLIRLRQEWARR